MGFGVGVGLEAESFDGVSLEVELDQHHRFVPLDPRVVAGLDGNDRRRLVIEGAAVCVLADEVTPSEESDVSMLAELGANVGLDVSRPAATWGVDQAFDSGVSDLADIDLHAGEVVPNGTVYWSEQWVVFHQRSLAHDVDSCRGRDGSSELWGLIRVRSAVQSASRNLRKLRNANTTMRPTDQARDSTMAPSVGRPL